ncbi:MAG: Rrf2 family transcriptional regulator [Candidatus Omnitrophota bacterium]|nr:Rrf2 family transcriptional regulator [Candidatus Omnitrophota bacterium]
MKLLTRDTDYAVRAICFIARSKEKKASVAELTFRLGMPRSFLRKILQRLNEEGLLESSKGKGGGFELAIKPEAIVLLDVMRIFQGGLNLNNCFLKKRICPEKNVCRLRREIGLIEKGTAAALSKISIASLIKSRHN